MYSDPSLATEESPSLGTLAASDPVLRRATRDDIGALYDLELSCFDPGMAFNRRQIAALIRNPRADCWVLSRDEKTIGQLIILRQKRRSGLFARIYSVTISPSERGRGYARQLLDWSIAEVRARGAQEIFLEVEATATAPIKLYASFDFVVQRQLENYYGEGRHGIKMLKCLRT